MLIKLQLIAFEAEAEAETETETDYTDVAFEIPLEIQYGDTGTFKPLTAAAWNHALI
jgi:hypothetical protein